MRQVGFTLLSRKLREIFARSEMGTVLGSPTADKYLVLFVHNQIVEREFHQFRLVEIVEGSRRYREGSKG